MGDRPGSLPAHPRKWLHPPQDGRPVPCSPDKYFSTSDRQLTLDFFSACDVVVNTLPDSAATRGFVGEEEFKAMKGDGVVTDPEPLPTGHVLYMLPNVVLTPHMSGQSRIDHANTASVLAVNVERVYKGKSASSMSG
ncbi:hypothetical protein JCM10207_001319 [Rhodosporidiobolus poonsookiae]